MAGAPLGCLGSEQGNSALRPGEGCFLTWGNGLVMLAWVRIRKDALYDDLARCSSLQQPPQTYRSYTALWVIELYLFLHLFQVKDTVLQFSLGFALFVWCIKVCGLGQSRELGKSGCQVAEKSSQAQPQTLLLSFWLRQDKSNPTSPSQAT